MGDAVEDELVGKLLGGRYRVTRRLSQGGMGVVYEATQEDLGRRVALKVMHPGLAQNRTAIERFRREALAAAALTHPHIVQITDLVQAGDGPAFLVMELLSGESMETAIQSGGRMDAQRVVFIAGQVLDALGVAHHAGIVHRDLKPANIFLTQLAGVADVVKLLDFGTAKLRESDEFARLTQTGQLIGTPLFMAPEQARGDAVDGRADIYSLGMVMYVALTGRAPFPTNDPASLLRAIQDMTPEPLSRLRPDVPRDLASLIEQATAKQPEGRFQTVDAMRAALTASGGTKMKADHAAVTSIHAPKGGHRAQAKAAALSMAARLAIAAVILLVLGVSVAVAAYVLLWPSSEPVARAAAVAAPVAPATASQTNAAASARTEPEKLPEGSALPAAPAREDAPHHGPAPSIAAAEPSARSRTLRAHACVPDIRLSPGRTYGLYSPDKLASALREPSAQAARCARLLPSGVASIPSIQIPVQMNGAIGRASFLGSLPSGSGRAGSCLRRTVESISAGPTETQLSGVVVIHVDLTPCTPPPWNSGG